MSWRCWICLKIQLAKLPMSTANGRNLGHHSFGKSLIWKVTPTPKGQADRARTGVLATWVGADPWIHSRPYRAAETLHVLGGCERTQWCSRSSSADYLQTLLLNLRSLTFPGGSLRKAAWCLTLVGCLLSFSERQCSRNVQQVGWL